VNKELAASDRDGSLEHLAAEVTAATYAVLLRGGMVANWLDLELDLWSALKETVQKWDRQWPRAGVMLCAHNHTHQAKPVFHLRHS
jgi:hypothetical protein